MSYGFVYLMSNPSMPCMYKVGMTERSPHKRADELSYSTSVPMPFDVVAYVEVEDARWMEGQMHGWLDEYRVNDSREFFSLRPASLPWLLGLFKFNPWRLAYTEADLSDFAWAGFDDMNPWLHGGNVPMASAYSPPGRGELRLVA